MQETTPALTNLSLRAVPIETSMIRPLMKGPRSVIVTIWVRLFVRLVTRTLVPKGRVRWAAVAPALVKRLPDAVAVPPFVLTEYHDILPRWVDLTT